MDIVRQAGLLGLQLWSKPYYGSLPPPSEKEQLLIDELRSAFRSAPRASTEVTSGAANLWEQFQERIRHLILTKDPREFLSWDVITKTMFLAFSAYASVELFHLKRRSDWNSRWKAALKESPVGRPARFPFYPRTSANLIHDAYTLSAFEDTTGVGLNQFHFVLEFGGGYGSMCRLLFSLGFHGRYVIYDLPPFSNLQAFYLKSLEIPVFAPRSAIQGENGVLLVSNADSLQSTDSYRTPKSLFIAAWSLSETSIHVRQAFMPHVTTFDAYLIAYQERFGEMNNSRFFCEWQEQTSETIEWAHVPIRHVRGGHHYLFGTRRASDLRICNRIPSLVGTVS